MFRPSRQDDGRRSAFTLLELLIVLVLLAFMVAITWPLLRKPMQRSLTEQAARQLREDLARARLNAIESGRTMAVHYELDGGKYWIAPADTATGDEPSPETLDNQRNSRGRENNGADAAIPLVIQGELEEEVVFQDPEAAQERDTTGGTTLDAMLADHMAETEEVEPLVDDSPTETSWSPAALIYPTGRAENAAFLLLGPEDYMVTVTLRGLTGAVSIGPLKQRSSTRRDGARQGEDGLAESVNQRPEDARHFPPDTQRMDW